MGRMNLEESEGVSQAKRIAHTKLGQQSKREDALGNLPVVPADPGHRHTVATLEMVCRSPNSLSRVRCYHWVFKNENPDGQQELPEGKSTLEKLGSVSVIVAIGIQMLIGIFFNYHILDCLRYI